MPALDGRNGKDPYSDYLDSVLEKSERKLKKRLRKVTEGDEEQSQVVPAGSQAEDVSSSMGNTESDDLMAATSRSAEAITESVDARIKQQMEELSTKLSSRPGQRKEDKVDQVRQTHQGTVYRLGELGRIKFAAEMPFLGRDLDLRVPATTVTQMASLVIGSPHVQSNEQYRQAAESVHLIINESNSLVNAFAAGVSVPGYEDIPPPIVAMFGGACTVAYVVSLVLGSIRSGDHRKIGGFLLPVVKRAGEMI